jgi:MFS family permease
MYFAGWAFTVIWVPLLADKVGRKWWFTGSTIIVFFTMIGFVLSPSLLISIILMFVAGAMNSGRVMVGFVYG